MKSRLLTHPLEPAAGGDEFHNGGRQFHVQDDPQFKTSRLGDRDNGRRRKVADRHAGEGDLKS